MGQCKGNRGNLMQHWVLCELLHRLDQDFKHLSLFCTHSMAPWSMPERRADDDEHRCRRTFNEARMREAAERNSVFETAWFALSPNRGLPYPSSAALALNVWQKDLSLSLCEASVHVAEEIDGWLATQEVHERVTHSVLLRGDWRSAAMGPLLISPDADILYIEMDPYRYDSRNRSVRKTTDPATVYPEDLNLLARCLDAEHRPLLLQISSFSAQNGNSPEAIEASVRSVLEPHRFVFRERVAVDGQMVSLVLARKLTAGDDSLQPEFRRWLSKIA